MSNAIEHFSRTRVEDTTLQVIADTQRNLDRLIREEETVIRHFIRLGAWPHKSVNMFVFENLQPLVAQIKNAAVLCSVVADDIDRRPMVNIYDAADLAECTVFVNRRALENEGIWNDAISLRALLAHEHSHPLAENATVRAARELSVEVSAEGRMPTRAIVEVLHLLADRLCVHSPQEVFANEIAIRAGFGAALFHLDRGVVAKARLGVGKRTSLVRGLEKRAKDGKLTAVQVTALLLVADLQAYLGFALETAPFLRRMPTGSASARGGADRRRAVPSRSGGTAALRKIPRPLSATGNRLHPRRDEGLERRGAGLSCRRDPGKTLVARFLAGSNAFRCKTPAPVAHGASVRRPQFNRT